MGAAPSSLFIRRPVIRRCSSTCPKAVVKLCPQLHPIFTHEEQGGIRIVSSLWSEAEHFDATRAHHTKEAFLLGLDAAVTMLTLVVAMLECGRVLWHRGFTWQRLRTCC